jgi:DNA-binding MarR family transcriptional regulator
MNDKFPPFASDDGLIIARPPRPHETAPMMINDISHLFHGKMRSVQTEGILSQHGARMILSILAHNEGLRQIDLVALTHMKAPTVSVIIKKMAAEGLVTHQVQASDLRANRLYLTEKGHEVHKTTHELLHATDHVMMQGFSDEEIEQLKALLSRVRENLVTDLTQNGLIQSLPHDKKEEE